jgi:ABC-2 type transport system permease protein
MNRTVLGKWLRDSRRSLAGWTVAVVAVGGMYAAFWPTMDDPQLQEALANYPQAILEALNYTDFSTAAGYLSATVYGLIVALLLLVFAISAGARLIAGDEEAGTLDLVQAHPVSRTSLALQRMAALAVALALIVVVFWVAMLALSGPAGFSEIGPGRLAAASVHLGAFAVLFGSASFGVGAATGRRGIALGVAGGAALLAYAAKGLLPQVSGLEWTSSYSAFTWLNGSEPLRTGIDWGYVGLMLAIAAVLVAAGTWAYGRRDIAA